MEFGKYQLLPEHQKSNISSLDLLEWAQYLSPMSCSELDQLFHFIRNSKSFNTLEMLDPNTHLRALNNAQLQTIFNSLAKCPYLKFFNIRPWILSKLSLEQIRMMFDTLSQSNSLEYVNFICLIKVDRNSQLQNLSTKKIKSIFNALSKLSSLHHIDLGGNYLYELNTPQLFSIFQPLSHSLVLSSIALRSNYFLHMDSFKLIIIFGLLKDFPSLTAVDLWNCDLHRLKPTQLRIIFESLSHNATLEQLYLGSNALGTLNSVQCYTIFNALSKNKTLKFISLNFNHLDRLDEICLFIVFSNLSKMPNLKSLGLLYNRFSFANTTQLNTISENISLSQSLRTLDLRNNTLDKKSASELSGFLCPLHNNHTLFNIHGILLPDNHRLSKKLKNNRENYVMQAMAIYQVLCAKLNHHYGPIFYTIKPYLGSGQILAFQYMLYKNSRNITPLQTTPPFKKISSYQNCFSGLKKSLLKL